MLRKFRSHLRRIVQCIDNELQHHKMYQKYVDLGFDPCEFYCDSDIEAAAYLERVITDKNQNFIDLFPDYMTAIAPGGEDPEKMIEIARKFHRYDFSRHMKRFSQIDGIIEEWVNSPSYDAEDTVKRIFGILRINDVWICNNEGKPDFPESGFFVDTPFNYSQIQH